MDLNNQAIFKKYCSKLLKIKDKDNRIVSFVFNYIQNTINENRTNRIIICKARQQGVSTYNLAYLFYKVVTVPNYTAVIITHTLEGAKLLFSIVRFFHQHLLEGLKPEVDTDNVRFLGFPDLGSKIFISAAGARAIGRGERISGLLLSELAFYKDTEILAGIMEGVPLQGDIIIESTANGAGGKFYELYQRAKREEISYKSFFFGWHLTSEYRIPCDERILQPYSVEEYELIKKYHLTSAQIAWRRDKIAILGEDSFKQEYPINDEECFLISSRPVFCLKNLTNRIRVPELRGELLIDNKLLETPKGRLKIFKKPEYNERYVIGADTSEGIKDNNIAYVLNIRNNEQAAIYCLLTDPDLFAVYIVRLAQYYNNARIIPEVNGSGLTALSWILRGNEEHRVAPYRHIYKRANIEREDEGKLTSFGWRTTRSSKILMIDELQAYLRQNEVIIYEQETMDELRNFIYHNDNSMGAISGSKDDRVMGLALALMGKKNYSLIKEEDITHTPEEVGDKITGY